MSSLEPLPDKVQGCVIYTDFRVILRTLRMLADPEITDVDKPALLRKMFFKDDSPQDADAAFAWFLRMGSAGTVSGGERDFDYEQDASEIYSAFRQVYGIDLLAAPLHWWQFSALLNGLFATENALSSKVRLRHIDDSEGKRQAAIAWGKEAARLKEPISQSDAAFEKRISERLKNGLPISDLMEEARRHG